MRRLIRLASVVLLLLSFVVSPAAGQAAPPQRPVRHTLRDIHRAEGLEVMLQTDHAPRRGEVATLTLAVTPLMDAPDLTVNWTVPPGVELWGEPVENIGAVAANQTIQVTRQARFATTGTHRVTASATFHWGDMAQFGAAGVLFFAVGAQATLVSDLDPDVQDPRAIRVPTTVTLGPELETPYSPDGDPCFNINIRVTRVEKAPVPGGGYGPNTRVPVRNIIVEVREEDVLFDDSYGERTTAEDGSAALHFCDDDGWFDDELEIYVRIRSEAPNIGEVQDSSWIDEVYEFDSAVFVADSSRTIQFNLDIADGAQSAIFNILDAIIEARRFLAASGGESIGPFSSYVNANWEQGYGDSTSHYVAFWNEITVADDPSDPDEWDDSVIMHEFGHFVDDHYSCDENPGDPHQVNGVYGDHELSFGEGYPDYFQSAVRFWRGDPNANFYIDAKPDGTGFWVNLETLTLRNVPGSIPINRGNEMAVAGALWDLMDNAVDGNDNVAWGHPLIQSVYLSDEFEDADNCNWDTFERAWKATGKPSNGPTAQAIVQNVGQTELSLAPFAALADTGLAAPNASTALHALPNHGDWWDKLVFVVDNSASMAGGKFAGVKTVLEEAANDLGQAPQGTEFSLYTFNNTATSQPVLEGKFFPEIIVPAVAGLTTIGGPDPTCQVDAFRALARALEQRAGVNAWVMTDGDTYTTSPTVEAMKGLLQAQQVRASFAVMGVCSVLMQEAGLTDTAETQEALNLMRGMARSYLGLAADPTPGGIVPYLLAAIASGGQFLWVSPGFENLAGDILRAQMTHSSGAGRWSDYVSNVPTYRYDTLASWEYQWLDGTTQVPASAGAAKLTVSLPSLFTLFGGAYYGTVDVYHNGYIVVGPYGGDIVDANTALPNPGQPNSVLYPFWDDLRVVIPPNVQSPQFGGNFGQVYTRQQGDWFVIEYRGFKRSTVPNDPGVTFEVLLNLTTYEIRYQYKSVPGGAGSATIGLENAAGDNAIQISYNDINGAKDNMGYKFVPAPPQPSKTYTVAVDSLMQGIGFLLTGYNSGFAANMTVQDPNGVPVNCAEQGTLCLYLGGRVQYIQTNVNGRTGIWTATVTASGQGTHTFSFSSMAAGALPVKSHGLHTLSTLGNARILINLGQAVDGNTLTGWFRRPTNAPFGSSFTMYDDGAHDDEAAGDGIFGSDPYAPGAGVGYLWVRGVLNGVEFVRSDPAAYNFQPLQVTALGNGANLGGSTALTFRITNADTASHCYNLAASAPEGWTVTLASNNICIGPNGTTADITATVWLAGNGQNNDLPSGTAGQVTLAVVENEKGSMSASAEATVTRYRGPAQVVIHNWTRVLQPNGDSGTLRVVVLDDQNFIVADGTPVQLATTLGTVLPTSGVTANGMLTFTLTSGPETGEAVITATASGATGDTTVFIIPAETPNQLALTAALGGLPADGQATTTVVATVHSRWNAPLANQTVRIGVSGDGQMGTIDGGEVITGTTNAEGQLVATYTSGTLGGNVTLRAELLVDDGGAWRVVRAAAQNLFLFTGGESRTYLPLLYRH